MKPAIDNTQPAKQLRPEPFPKPIKNFFPSLFCWIAGISSFLILWAMLSYAPCVSLERRSILIEQLTTKEQEFYNNASPEALEIRTQEKLKQINHTPIPGWKYRSRQINGQNQIEAFRRNKFTYNEVMGLLISTGVLPLLYMISLAAIIVLLCLLTFRYNKTLLALSSRLSHPLPSLPSPVWDPLLLAIPLINLIWIWPSSIRIVHNGEKLSRLRKIPYKGPSMELALATSLLLPSLSLCFNLAVTRIFPYNIILHIPCLIIIYRYMKKLNFFIDDISKEAGDIPSAQTTNLGTEATPARTTKKETNNAMGDEKP